MLVSSVVNNNQISGAGRFKVGAGAVSFLVLCALCHQHCAHLPQRKSLSFDSCHCECDAWLFKGSTAIHP